MGVASGFSQGSDRQWMVTEVGVAFSCWLSSVTIDGRESG